MKVLFIGNSHTFFNDMPHLFATLCRGKGITTHVTMLTRGGMGLDDHVKQEQTRFNILYGGYDYVVLQHTAHPMGDLNDMHDAAQTIVGWIREAGAEPILYQTWAKKGDEAFQNMMSSVYFALGRELEAAVAPVGDEWQKERVLHPEIEFYWEDGQHASPAGSALAARVILETILKTQK